MTSHRYCAVCDHYYEKGKFIEHRTSAIHRSAVEQRLSMAKWYKANGS